MSWSAEQAVILAEAVQRRGREVVRKAIILRREDNHDWSKIKSPSALFISKLSEFMSAAEAALAGQREFRQQEERDAYMKLFDQHMSATGLVSGSPEWVAEARNYAGVNPTDPTDPWVRSVIADLVKARRDCYLVAQRTEQDAVLEAELQRTGYAGLFG